MAVMGRWKGLSGVQQIPSLGQWQQLMTSNSIFLYLGYSPLLSYLSPGEIAGIQLQGLLFPLLFPARLVHPPGVTAHWEFSGLCIPPFPLGRHACHRSEARHYVGPLREF